MEEAQIKQIIKRQPLHGSALLDPRCKILLLVCIGFVSYFLFCFWLIRYDVFSALGVYALFGVYWAVIFALLQIFSKTRKYAFIFNILILFFAEFLFTKGYFAFGYGVSAYTQWKISILTRAVRYTKIWGLDFLIIFFN